MPRPGSSVTPVGSESSSPRSCRADDEALGEDVHRHLVERGCESERLRLREVAERDDPLELRLAERQRSGLVEQDGPGAAEALQRAGSLDDDPGPCRTREPGHERDRSGQDQRARRCHDHHGETARRVAGGEPGEPGDGEREGEEVGGVAVGEPCEPRPVDLGRLHQPDDRRVGALGGHRGDAKVERVAGVGGAGADVPVARDA